MACNACENTRMKAVYEVINCPTVRNQPADLCVTAKLLDS